MIKAIVFDLWETLGTKNIGISKTLMEHFGIEKTPNFLQKYEKSIQLKKWENQEDMGRSFLESFNIPCTKGNIEFVVETLQRGIDNATLFKGINELLNLLKENYKLALLSNTTVFESEIIKKWNIEPHFDVQIYSWQIGALKPAERIFHEVCEQLHVKPSECIFIDDGKKNIEAAKKIGAKGIQFQNIEQLKKDLASFSIKIG